jgi:hypothetical protein
VRRQIIRTSPQLLGDSVVLATVSGADGSAATGGIWELQEINGCTYEPTSSIGIVIVRHLLNSALTLPMNPGEYQTYALIDTGVLP